MVHIQSFAVVLLGLVVAACGGDETASSSPTPTPTPMATPSPSPDIPVAVSGPLYQTEVGPFDVITDQGRLVQRSFAFGAAVFTETQFVDLVVDQSHAGHDFIFDVVDHLGPELISATVLRRVEIVVLKSESVAGFPPSAYLDLDDQVSFPPGSMLVTAARVDRFDDGRAIEEVSRTVLLFNQTSFTHLVR